MRDVHPMTAPADSSAGVNDEGLARYTTPDMLRHIVLDFRQMKGFLAEPLVMARAEGVLHWDTRGKRYLDGISGIFVANIGHTNPLSAAGVAVIQEIVERDLCGNARRIGAHLRGRLAELADLNVIADIRGKGLLIGVGLACDKEVSCPWPV